MTQEQKDKLLKYLCAALPYDVFMTNKEYPETHYPFTWREVHDLMYEEDFNDIPYLRPMSSSPSAMTEDEEEEYHDLCFKASDLFYDNTDSIEWLLEHHFDFMGLIDKGLAISTDNFNPYN